MRRRDRDNPTQLHAYNATNSGEQQANTTNWLLLLEMIPDGAVMPNPVPTNLGWFRAIVNGILINS